MMSGRCRMSILVRRVYLVTVSRKQQTVHAGVPEGTGVGKRGLCSRER